MLQRTPRVAYAAVIGAVIAVAIPTVVSAQDDFVPTAESLQFIVDNLWVMLAGCLVFFMQAGFALVETGLTRAKNAVNIMAKNMADMMVGVVAFFVVGFGFAFSEGNNFIGTSGFFLSGETTFADFTAFDPGAPGELSIATLFFFQVVFAATAVTIASGAMAERTKFPAYLVFAAFMCAIIYPVVVHWTWGGGLIEQIEIGDAVYSDFAGSGVVHLTGGVAAFMGALFLGARIGKYTADGKPRAIPGHNIPIAIIGVFILWLGWFGFNAGSELGFFDGDTRVMFIVVNTLLSACAGGLAAAATTWFRSGKPDVTMTGNGVLAGLVGITAGCGTVNHMGALVIGAIAGVIVVFSVIFLDRVKIDDPVGAVSVHGTCGVWGLLAIGLFARYDDAFLGRENAGLFYGGGIEQLVVQALMALIIIAWVAVTTGILFFVIKKTMGLRVSEQEEHEGLDVLEHGQSAYTEDVVA